MQEAPLCWTDHRALAQAAQRLWGPLLGDLPEPPGRGPGHPALRVPAGQWLEQRDPEGPASLSCAEML